MEQSSKKPRLEEQHNEENYDSPIDSDDSQTDENVYDLLDVVDDEGRLKCATENSENISV